MNIKTSESDSDPDTDRGLFTRLTDLIVTFVICSFLIKLGIQNILSVRVPLIIISVIVIIAIAAYRVWKWRHHDDY